GRGRAPRARRGRDLFLTTQYLEEADVLADRVGIIDHGHIVAEGTPAELKASVGRPTVEAVPADPADRDRAAAILARFGKPCGSERGVAVRLESGETDLAGRVRAVDAGTDLAGDIQTGFLSRRTLTPMRRLAVLGGQLGGVVTMGLVQAVVYLSVGLLVGVHVKAGPLGILVLLVFAVFVALAFGAIGALAALRTGSGE